jgi:hypothetical protein
MKRELQPEVAAKYNINDVYLNCNKLQFPHQKLHGIGAKPASQLTLAEVDKLVECGAVDGVFTLKVQAEHEPKVIPATKPSVIKSGKGGNKK